jgi:integrase
VAERIHFTKATVERLPTPERRRYYRDTKEPRLGLYVTEKGHKSFFAMVTIGGKSRRIPVGRFPDTSVPLARLKAAETASEVAKGVDPVQAKRDTAAASLTLSEVLETYLEERELKDSTRRDYRKALGETFGQWLERPLAKLDEAAVLRLYRERGKASKARADNAARVLRALCNFARGRYKRADGTSLFANNPTDILNEAKVRFRIQRRRTAIAAHDLRDWWASVHGLSNHIARDYLVFLLMCGTRREETARLQWQNVNLKSGTFHIANPKNGIPVTLPLPGCVAHLLALREETEGWVFPGPPKEDGTVGYLTDPRKSIVRVRRESGVAFTLHDLRRTYTSLANGLDISVYTVKALLNHRLSQSDVTAGYDVPDMDRLKRASAKIEDRILRLVGAAAGTVVELRAINHPQSA